MAIRSHRTRGVVAGFAALLCLPAQANAAFLFWNAPDFAGAPVKGDEPGLGVPLPGATSKELTANLIWNMRAGLNVAALQCQFSPTLMTVSNYNTILKQHGKEFADAYAVMAGYFKRTAGKAWQVAQDQYTTRTYQSFSTMHAQRGFCDTAGSIGREALGRPRGQLYVTAENRMREFRNSLVPAADRLLAFRVMPSTVPMPAMDDRCWKKGELKTECAVTFGAYASN
ncbi:hypothetical protein [Flavisphingomonas formosensis]|uniref:hypothetical protein n=1 Tax=Flavisphingomonas formosensis TaxID=861534 RepID=UPI0012FB1C16|nr:hypothetical protein [Sphingomonas formosensis]